ncbi:MAG: elongation factor Ts, partial [Coxiellaceae bacterium]|nr:elongation factor Ts [Coxiellaceae bacterium]
KTGVGMMECKKALVTANGDMEAAIEALRKAGQAKAVKKGDRIAAEGLVTIALSPDQLTGVIVETNCETDFVGREARFREFCKNVAATALNKQSENIADDLEDDRLALVSQIGENINIRRITIVKADAGGVVVPYLHGADAEFSRIGVLVAVNPGNADLARDIAMHIAAMKPEYLSEADIPKDRLAKEKEILMAQAKEANAGKPEEILEKIITGRLNKFMQEVTLLGQPFVKDPDQTVAKLLKSANTNVTNYVRYEVGEGIEKKVDDFVNEVMSQVKS